MISANRYSFYGGTWFAEVVQIALSLLRSPFYSASGTFSIRGNPEILVPCTRVQLLRPHEQKRYSLVLDYEATPSKTLVTNRRGDVLLVGVGGVRVCMLAS